uniref:W2 domain-containing protein n=1 Tax=Spongospora subterranea TaxID=70186 RepID=A0A0H5RL08_9EUKA|eukprot:CRZ09409.1 hypothetical protein [Spongospora subterranea]
MAEINIGGDPNDRSYRYKRPRCTTKIEGRGNGIKTVICNMVDVAKALKITPSYPTKFFGIELGAQSKYDEGREVAVVNGSHDTSVIETVLEKFIDTYVLCPSPSCRLPEIRLKVKKGQIRADCAACGYQATVGDTHKLTVYIIKNPPSKSRKSASDTGKPDKKKDKEKRSKKSKDEERDKTPENKPVAVSEPVTEVWYTDASEAAAEKRLQEDKALNGDNGADIDKLIESVQINTLVAANAPAEEVLLAFVQHEERSDVDIMSELRRLELSRGLSASSKAFTLLSAVLDVNEVRTLPVQIKKRSALLRQFTRTRGEAQIFFSAIESMICNNAETCLPRTALILQALYENDVVSEDVLVDWFDSPMNISGGVSDYDRQDMHDRAKVFIDWLKAAESDEEDDDDEDD